jgi:hypothetical protein
MLQTRTHTSTLHKVKAHANVDGNELGDTLAKLALVENYANKNCHSFPIAVLLTTLTCCAEQLQIFIFWFSDCNFNFFVARNILLERYFQDLSNFLVQTPKFLEF